MPKHKFGRWVSEVDEPRLPKQIEHWFELFGVKFDARYGTGYSTRKTNLVGCAKPYRHFRVLRHLGIMQICDGYFDRWANSVGAEVTIPKTEAEFRQAMATLLATAKLEKVEREVLISDAAQRISWADRDIQNAEEWYGDIAKWVRHHGILCKSDRNVVKWYNSMMGRARENRRYWMKQFRMHAPNADYHDYLREHDDKVKAA